MQTTILVFHPDFPHSKANRALATAAGTLSGVEVVEMGDSTPTGRSTST